LDSRRLNRWLTLGANIGVVVGIIFLAIELRQNNELLQSEAGITYVQARVGALANQLENPELLDALFRARQGEQLEPLDRQRLEVYYRMVFAMWDWEYGQYDDNLLYTAEQPPAGRWRPSVEYYPYMRESWPLHKSTYSERFVRYMEDHVLGAK
jgi:hypothetical protein